MIRHNSNVNIYQKTTVIYEGEPPDNLNIRLVYDEAAKFQIKSSVELSETNAVTITGELDDDAVVEAISCSGFITEGTEYFDAVDSFTFSFDESTRISIRAITSNGDDNSFNKLIYSNIKARVRDLKWSKTLLDMGVNFEKSKMIYLPHYLSLDNTFVIEYNEEDYNVIEITRGLNHQEVIITRID